MKVHDVRLGVTGLRRTGKTVFLTALIYQLHELGSARLDAFENKAVSFPPAPLKPLAGNQRSRCKEFPYEENLANLRSRKPVWPHRTVAEFERSLEISYTSEARVGWRERARSVVGRGRHQGKVRLSIHDYPGEFLLDVEMLELDFESWSAKTLRRIREQCVGKDDVPEIAALYEACVAYEQAPHEAINTLAEFQNDPTRAQSVLRRAYLNYVLAARRANMERIQPGMALATWEEPPGREQVPERDMEPKALAEFLPFVPLPSPAEMESEARAGKQRYQMLFDSVRGAYDSYRQDRIRPFVEKLKRCNLQIVLVDVLKALTNGVDCYNDMRKAIGSVVGAYDYTHRGLWTPGGISHVVFAATKADHACRADRRNMSGLLEKMVDRAVSEIKNNRPHHRRPMSYSYEWFTSLRATKDAKTRHDGREVDVLRGRIKGKDEPSDGWNPGTVPPEWPTERLTLTDTRYLFHEFEPVPLSPMDGAELPHSNLDSLLWLLLKDYF